MVKSFQVSVNIPVYNAANFVRQAVESALIQPQTAEVVLVEDCSTDNSWEVCQQIAFENDMVRLFRHEDGRNHGCSASRSLAVQKSSCDYIAFLDADDFFLPSRFDLVEQMFTADPRLDGVYEAIGATVENEASMQRWKDAGRVSAPLTTLTKRVPAEELFTKLVLGGAGSISTDGVVVKRSIFEKIGYFDETLRLHMDDIFLIKAAALAKLLPGKLDGPVAMRRIHETNRISELKPNGVIYKMRIIFWYTLWKWSQQHVDCEKQQLILQAMLREAGRRMRFNRQFPARISGFRKSIQLLMLPFQYPFVLRQRLYWRELRKSVPVGRA